MFFLIFVRRYKKNRKKRKTHFHGRFFSLYDGDNHFNQRHLLAFMSSTSMFQIRFTTKYFLRLRTFLKLKQSHCFKLDVFLRYVKSSFIIVNTLQIDTTIISWAKSVVLSFVNMNISSMIHIVILVLKILTAIECIKIYLHMYPPNILNDKIVTDV